MKAVHIEKGSIAVDGTHRQIKVRSTSRTGLFHYVTVNWDTGEIEKCSCEDYGFRPGVCKHIKAVIEQRLLQTGR